MSDEYPVKILRRVMEKSALPGELARTLPDCAKALVFAATLGHAADAALRSAFAKSASEAVELDSRLNLRISRACSQIQEEAAAGLGGASPVFFPGGELPLAAQSAILSLLNARRRGVYENEAHMLLPSKTLTGVIALGVSGGARAPACGFRCAECAKPCSAKITEEL
ncbi:MAG: hypothetical protein LBU36_04610 [Clostridiales bacterium]|jgi:hypothetical protein|nr:hypothetical protein [Clostridiales bacterium]